VKGREVNVVAEAQQELTTPVDQEVMYLGLRMYPDAALRTVCQPWVESIEGNQKLQHLLSSMEKTLDGYQAAGLAAPQVGILYRIMVVRLGAQAVTMINPRITAMEAQMVTADEGCLSFPGLFVSVSRNAVVTVTYQDRQGCWQKQTLTGVEARAVQHEIDHLDGKTFLDRIPVFHRRGALERMRLVQRKIVGFQKKLVVAKKPKIKRKKK